MNERASRITDDESRDGPMLPCPYCEGPPATVVQFRGDDGQLIRDAHIEESEAGLHARAFVFCHECGAEGPAATDIVFKAAHVDTIKAKAKEVWNRRDARHRELYDAGVASGLFAPSADVSLGGGTFRLTYDDGGAGEPCLRDGKGFAVADIHSRPMAELILSLLNRPIKANPERPSSLENSEVKPDGRSDQVGEEGRRGERPARSATVRAGGAECSPRLPGDGADQKDREGVTGEGGASHSVAPSAGVALITPSSATEASDPGTEKLLREMLDRAYKMMQMAGYRVVEQDPDHNNPVIAWMADARAVLYGGTKHIPDVGMDLQGKPLPETPK